MDLKNPKYNPFFVKDYFIFEYGAIPSEVREKFIKKVLKRKGAFSQKNIRLLQFLENTVRSGKFDENEYSGLIDFMVVSSRMLDCHKSRLIKQLREFYFGWEVIKGESEIETIRRRFSAGMLREARTELIQLEKKIPDQKCSAEQNTQLYEIYEKLFQYYYFTRDLRRTNLYFGRARKLCKRILSSKSLSMHKAEIKARFTLLISYKLTMNRFKRGNLEMALKQLTGLLNSDKNAIPANLRCRIYHRCGLLFNILRDKENSIKAFLSARELAAKHNFEAEFILSESFLKIRNFTDNNHLAAEYLEFHKNNFPKMLKARTDVSQLLEFELNYLRFLIYASDPLAEEITSDYLSRQILYSRKADALNSWYLELSDQHSSSVFEWKKNGERYSVNVDKNILSAFTEMNRISVRKFSNIYSANVQAILYINIAEQEFWKCTKADFFLAESNIKKLERIMRLYNINISSSWIESAKLGLKIFEMLEKQNAERVYKRFSRAITRFISKIKSRTQSFNIASDLAKLLFINEALRVRKLDEEINGFISWIAEVHPDVLLSINQGLR